MNSKTTSGKSFSNSFNKSVNLEKSKRFPPLNYESYSVLDEESSLLFESEDFNHTLKHIIEQYGSFSQYVHQLSSPYNQTDIEGTVINTTSRANYIPVFNFPLSEVYSIVQENNTGSYLGPTAKIVIMVLYVTLIVVGTFGNVMVALIIVKRKEMRTAANIYVMNLTVSDITLCLICMPFTLAGLMVKNWKLGSLICKLVPVLQCTNILVSTATIVAIAGDRYMAIVRIGSRPRSKHCNQLSVAAIWAVSLVFPLPLFSYYFVEPVKIENILLYERCVEVWSSRKTQMTWTITLIVIQYVIPILVLIFVHIQIKNFLSRHQMSSLSATRKSQELERNRRTTILLTTIAGTFAVSWLPWHVVNLLADFHYFHSPEYFYAVFGSCHILAMSTACSNPVLYGWLNTNLRREMRALMTSFFKSNSLPFSGKDRSTDDGLSNAMSRRLNLQKLPLKHTSNSDHRTHDNDSALITFRSPVMLSTISVPMYDTESYLSPDTYDDISPENQHCHSQTKTEAMSHRHGVVQTRIADQHTTINAAIENVTTDLGNLMNETHSCGSNTINVEANQNYI